MSSAAAAVIVIVPKRVRVMLSSIMIRASTGMAVIASATPRKSANPVSGGIAPDSGCGSRNGWISGARPSPNASGNAMPATEILRAAVE